MSVAIDSSGYFEALAHFGSDCLLIVLENPCHLLLVGMWCTYGDNGTGDTMTFDLWCLLEMMVVVDPTTDVVYMHGKDPATAFIGVTIMTVEARCCELCTGESAGLTMPTGGVSIALGNAIFGVEVNTT